MTSLNTINFAVVDESEPRVRTVRVNRPVPNGRKDAFNRIRRAQVLPDLMIAVKAD